MRQGESTETAIFAGGCFWGVEHLMKRVDGVLRITSGYIGGTTDNPSYEQVCTGRTGHAEAVEIVFDPGRVSYAELVRIFFNIHDPEQRGGQGPDMGEQYRSEIFYTTSLQKEIAENTIRILDENGYRIATKVTAATTFWPAEDYHQDHYERTGKTPYCHRYVKRI